MGYQISKADVWVGKMVDRPGTLGKVLAKLNQAGAQLEFLFARPHSLGQGVVFLAPLRGARQLKVAKSFGLVKWDQCSIRISGPDRKGLGALIASALGDQGVNLQGISAMGSGKTCLFYVAVAKKELPRAQRILKKILSS